MKNTHKYNNFDNLNASLDVLDFVVLIINIEKELDRILKYLKYFMKDKYNTDNIIKACGKIILESTDCDLIIKSKLLEMIECKLKECL